MMIVRKFALVYLISLSNSNLTEESLSIPFFPLPLSSGSCSFSFKSKKSMAFFEDLVEAGVFESV